LLAAVTLTFLIAKNLFDDFAAWLSAALMLGSDLLWRFSVSGQSTLLLLVIFLGLIWCLLKIEGLVRAEMPDPRRLFLLALTAGLLLGLGLLTRYSFGWLLVPVVVFVVLFGGERRLGLAVATCLAFVVVIAPWIARNLAVSGTFFGTAGYAVAEGTFGFPGSRLMQSFNPDMTSAYWISPYTRKLMENLRYICPGELLRLGGGWMGVLFLAGLLLGLRNLAARRLRYFAMMCLGMFILVEALGRTELSSLSPELNSENLLALLTPLVVIFGVAFFLTLLNQMNVPTPQVRYGVIALLVVLACQPLIATLLPPKVSPVSYPPYYPPEIQKICGWMKPDELLMSDVPWAVAWYGGQQCSWTTINSQYEYFALNDNLVKPVRGLYLTLGTLDAKLFSECLQGGVDSWGNFVLKTVAANQIPPQFPLRVAPYGLLSGLFLTDRQRWASQ
jgi:4-amino-4-deoxy-L-arabinose transferase-like glycosyltransferase